MPASPSKILRIAFLGADVDALELARAAAASSQFRVVGYCETETSPDGAGDSLVAALPRTARRFDSWEALLDADVVDAVIVARAVDEDARTEQLRKLTQVGIALVVVHPVVDSMLVYYELDMIRRDTQAVIVPYLPAREHPAIRRLAEMAAQSGASPIGRIEQVLMERSMGTATAAAVTRQFARDVDLLRSITGDLTRLGAMAAPGDTAGYAGLGVQMSGPMGIVARWSVDPLESGQAARLSVLASRGKSVVQLGSLGKPWSFESIVDGRTELETYEAWSGAEETLSQLSAAMAGAEPVPSWVDAARSVELSETIPRSLQKSRTIELYYEDYTEEGTFKGTMTSVGCALLILGLFLLGAVAIADQIGVPYVRYWPYALVAILVFFLLLQFLTLVFRKRLSESDAAEAPDIP